MADSKLSYSDYVVNADAAKGKASDDHAESTVDKLWREARLWGGATAEGAYEHGVQEMQTPEGWVRLAASVGISAGLTYFGSKVGMFGSVARGAGLMMGINFLSDAVNPNRLSSMFDASADAWHSADNFSTDYYAMKKAAGPLAFDTTVGMFGGALGGGLGYSLRRSPALEIKEPLSTFKPEPTQPGTHTEAFRAQPTEPLSRMEAFKPLAEEPLKPLNVYSKSEEPLGRAISNFGHTPFVLDGKEYASVEAFYNSLKFSDLAKRDEIAPLYGTYAKSFANKAKANFTEYNGQQITLGSPEHHALVERAIRAKFEQNPHLLTELVATGDRPIVHDTGRPESPKTRFPGEVFTDILTRIRAEHQASGLVPMPSEASSSWVAAVDATGGKSEQVLMNQRFGNVPGMRSVSDALTGIKDPKLNEFHNLPHYARAFSDFGAKSERVLGGGSDTVSLLLDNGNVLKVGTRELPFEAGQRAFDAPILESGTKMVDGRPVRYYIQPHAEPATDAQLSDFLGSLKGTKYYMNEPFVDQLGVINGQVKLLDPWAVKALD